MIEIRNTAGLALQLPPDARVSVELVGTILNTDDVLAGSYSYPFRFPLTDHNIRFIQSGHLPERDIQPELSVRVTLGPLSFTALMGYKTSGLYADGYFLIDLAEVAERLRTSSLRTLVKEQVRVTSAEGLPVPSLRALADAPPGQYPIVFPPFRNPEMVEADYRPITALGPPVAYDETYKRPLIVNRYRTGTLDVYRNAVAGMTPDTLLVPMVYLTWLLRYVCAQLGFTAAGSLLTDPDLNRLVLFNTQTVPGQNIDTGEYVVEISRHLPDITVSEFFKALRTYVGCSIDFDARSRTARFDTYRALRRVSSYLDMSEGIVADQLSLERSGVSGFIIKSQPDSQDKALTESNQYATQFRVGGQNAQEITLGIGTLTMWRGVNLDFSGPYIVGGVPKLGTWQLPQCIQPGNLADKIFENSANYSPYHDPLRPDTVPPAKNPFGFRLLMYHGMEHTDLAGHGYPYAASVSYDAQLRVFGTLSLLPGQPDDVFQRYQRYYYEFLTYSKKLSQPLRLSLTQLNALRPSLPIGLRGRNLVLGRYLLEKLTYELPAADDGRVLAKLDARQLLPILIKPNIPEEDLYAGVWVQIVFENAHNDVAGTTTTQYADVVLYVWLDGRFVDPAPTPNRLVNYSRATTVLTANNQSDRVIRDFTAQALAHRTVIEAQALIGIYKQGALGVPYPIQIVEYRPQPGTGYRLPPS